MINRLIEPTAATIELDGRDVARRCASHELRRGIGYVIQQAGLFPHRNVADNVTTVPQAARLGQGSGQRKRALELLELVGLEPGMADRYPASSPAASSSASASPARSPPTRRCC